MTRNWRTKGNSWSDIGCRIQDLHSVSEVERATLLQAGGPMVFSHSLDEIIDVRSKAELKAALEKFVADTAPTATTTNL